MAFPAAGQERDATPKRPHPVTQGELVTSCEVTGRIDSPTRVPILYYFKEFTGALAVAEVHVRSGPVKKGDPILRLDGDLYVSTMDALKTLYPKVSPGGYVYVDDYGSCAHMRVRAPP